MTGIAKTNPPFRAEHVGSLLRPAELRQAFRAHSEGRMSAAEFRAVQDGCIRKAVALQQEIGLQAVNDGEFRRASYWSHFVDGIDGLDVAKARFDFHDAAGHDTEFLAPKVTGKLSRAKSISGGEFDFLASVTTATPKLTLPSPPTMHFWARSDAVRHAGYDVDGFCTDLAEIYRQEIADLWARGARYIQIDEVPLAMLCDDSLRQAARARGEHPDELVETYIALINASLADRPAGMTVAMHLCRGNFKGMWLAEGSYRYVAERLFNDIEVDAFFLEYDTPRAGDFAPLASVPAAKSVVLGLVSTKTPALESAAELRRRIQEASRFLPLERLAISPQCGFASVVSSHPVTLADQIAKLKLVVEVADQVWG